jgi:phage terminase large subunit-like protein
MKFYIPEVMAGKRTKADQLNFSQWGREGHITLTPGDATDYNYIKTDILNICSNFDYKPIAYDKALASMFMIQLYNEHSINVESFSQSVGAVTGPTKQLYEWIMNETLIHDNSPVMAWMISNVEVYQDDANGNYKIHKGKSKNKVDGPCAVVNAIGRALEDWKDNPIIDNYVW